ncbi:MAG: Hsp20/alpha crystallin family protein [Deltaproteobacteria bacterium]|nr:Hsp20/alpha crystallin family protein [Deltaproteobacteria bacterium]
MALVKWDPFGDVAELQNRINRMFDESFGGPRDLDDEMNSRAWRPAVDIYESDNGIIVAVELPGVSKQNVSVEVKDDVLTLKGERRANPAVKEDSYYLRERLFGPFKRIFTLHQNIQPELIKATFKEGILEIELPKPAQEHPRQITVNVE